MQVKKKKKVFQNPYGYFNEDNEFVITRPDTPKPWINYLSNHTYHALVSQTGGGYSYYKDSKLHRVLHWEGHRSDRPGRYVFIRDEENNEVWTPNWQPLGKRLDHWQAKHGFGYSEISSEYKKIATSITYFVSQEDPCEIWLFKIKNKSTKSKKLKLYPYVHWLLGDYYLEQGHKNIMNLYNEAYYDPKSQTIVAFKHQSSARKYETYGFFATSLKPKAYELNYDQFVGQYGSIVKPKALLKGKLSSKPVRGEEMIGVFEQEITLEPGEEVTLSYVLGFSEKKSDIDKIVKKNVNPTHAKGILQKTKVMWKNKLGALQVNTPDPDFDRMTNSWGQYQLYQITRWRSASFYAPGEGGRGYRDTSQDAEAVAAIDSYLSREWIEKLLGYQYQSGHAVAGFSEIEGPWEIGDDQGILGKSDVACWIPSMISAYVKETGDVEFLKKVIPYMDKGEATVWEHCVQSMNYFWTHRGKHGLPLFWKADWNDAFDQCGIKGKGESVWLGMAYCRSLLMVEELAHQLNDKKQAKIMRERYEKIKSIINDIGWDGDWYLRLFTDSGKSVGSKSCKEGQVYLNAQSWAILSQVAPELRAKKCLKAIQDKLDTKFGPVLFAPPYSKYDPEIGRITSFAAGTKENAAVFSHAAAFLVVAYAMAKDGKRAYELFSQIAPYHPEKTPKIYKTEPYVYAEYVYGPENDHFGLGAFNWNTGTAAWMFTAATQWMVGVKPTFDGLIIDPCVPSHWESFSLQRPFRGAIYDIKIKNPNRKSSGVIAIKINGKKISGNKIPVMPKGKVYEIEVIMG